MQGNGQEHSLQCGEGGGWEVGVCRVGVALVQKTKISSAISFLWTCPLTLYVPVSSVKWGNNIYAKQMLQRLNELMHEASPLGPGPW